MNITSIHCLNVSPGDCTIIRHANGHTSMIDICNGNRKPQIGGLLSLKPLSQIKSMSERLTNPIQYLNTLGIQSLFRFILTHPDMDHLDGFNQLVEDVGVTNFWDTGLRREKPDFTTNYNRFQEEDWDRYIKVIEGREKLITSKIRQAGHKFTYANKDENGVNGGDGLYILSPDSQLVKEGNQSDDINDSSYVILCKTIGGNILIPGDAHDKTWEYVIEKYGDEISNCSFLLAPHHGRDSGRSYNFLDYINPKLTLIASSSKKHTDHEQWKKRGLDYVTSDRVGNLVLEVDSNGLGVYIENHYILNSKMPKNSGGYSFLYYIPTPRQARIANEF